MRHLPGIALLLTTTTIITSAASDVASEVNSIINDTIVNLAGGDSSKVAATTDGLMHIFTALSTAASLSIFFFKYLIGFMIRITMYLISPLIWLFSTCWHQFVTKPLDLFLHVLHVLYPVIMFCVAAICCGIFIGGCAGFAAEAFSSILISATWGPQPSKGIEQEKTVELVDRNEGFTDESDIEEEEQENINNQPPNFFGSTKIKKGKEPLIPRVESWRDSLSTSSTSSSPVLIRRKKLSTKDRKNSWEWDEDTEEEEVEFNNFKNK